MNKELRKIVYDIMRSYSESNQIDDMEGCTDDILSTIKSYLLKNGPKERHLMGVLGDDDYLTDIGFNQALQSYKDFIKGI